MPGHYIRGALAHSVRTFANRAAPPLLVVILTVLSSIAVRANPLTLAEAWALADQVNPDLRIATASLDAARGQLKDAQGLLWNNPQIATDLTRRTLAQPGIAGQNFGEWNVGLSQTFELAGQHAYRRQAAELDLDATHERIAELRRQLHAAVEQRFSELDQLNRHRHDFSRPQPSHQSFFARRL